MPRRPHRAVAVPLALLLALTLLACTTSEDPLPAEFDAGPVDSFPPQTIVTFADRTEVQRATSEGSTGDHLFGGNLVFHLVRLQSGDFLALSARDPRSDCWTVWDTDADLQIAIPPRQPEGSFRDPCHGTHYDVDGTHLFGPAPRDLSSYPVELRDGHVHITLTDEVLIVGQKTPRSDANSTPTPTRTPRPVPTRPGSLATTIPTPEPTAITTATSVATSVATATATVTPLPTATPLPLTDGGFAPTEGAPWTAVDYVAALEQQSIDVAPTGRTFACTEVGGLSGAEYDGDVNFLLWVYPSPEAAATEWMFAPYGGYHPLLACNRPPARVYVLDNLALWLPADPPYVDNAIIAADTFLQLPGMPLPSELHGAVIAPPAEGVPLSAAGLLAALKAQGLTYIPYTSLIDQACPPGQTSATLHWVGGPAPGEGPGGADFRLWVFPSAAALEAEWNVGVDGSLGVSGVHRPRLIECDFRGGTIHRNANMLITFGGGVWDGEPEYKAKIVDTFLALQP